MKHELVNTESAYPLELLCVHALNQIWCLEVFWTFKRLCQSLEPAVLLTPGPRQQADQQVHIEQSRRSAGEASECSQSSAEIARNSTGFVSPSLLMHPLDAQSVSNL